MSEQRACIFNIQKYSIHDGPGIRTVVFFKGCPLQCLWCSNPESQFAKPQLAWDETKCNRCRKCVDICPNNLSISNNRMIINNSSCKSCNSCVQACPNKALSIIGEYKTVDEVIKEIIKDQAFYEESNGGITLSGGEVLLQHEFAIELLKRAKSLGIHTACETTGYCKTEIFLSFIEHIDLILFDMKHYDDDQHFANTKVHNHQIIFNLETAIKLGKDVIVRIPVIPSINDSLEDAHGFCKLLKGLGVTKVNLLPFHQFGQKKYSLLNKEYLFAETPQLHEEDLVAFKEIFIQNGLDCE